MKYWKKSNGVCGTMDNNGHVPESIEVTKTKYDTYVATQPIIEHVEEIIEYEDLNTGKILKLRKVN